MKIKKSERKYGGHIEDNELSSKDRAKVKYRTIKKKSKKMKKDI